MSFESDESIPEEGLMVDARHTSLEEEFFIINPDVNPMVRLADVVDIIDNSLFVFVFLSNG